MKILSDGRRIEVGTTGCEGMVGMPAFLGAKTVPLQCFIQVARPALRLSADAHRRAAPTGSALDGILQRHAQYLFIQAAQSLACNRLHQVYGRCARWLLMTHDRVGFDRFELKHKFLALMLGVRRASVSQAAEAMRDSGFIRYRRAKITIVDRVGLEGAACECYAADRADLERLLPHVRPPVPAPADGMQRLLSRVGASAMPRMEERPRRTTETASVDGGVPGRRLPTHDHERRQAETETRLRGLRCFGRNRGGVRRTSRRIRPARCRTSSEIRPGTTGSPESRLLRARVNLRAIVARWRCRAPGPQHRASRGVD